MYSTFLPSEPLRLFVEQYFLLRQEDEPSVAPQLITAEPHSFIVFQAAGESLYYDRDKSPALLPSCFLAGQMTYPTRLRYPSGAEQLGIRFRVGGLYPFLAVPASDLTNEVVALDAVWGAAATALESRLAECKSPREKCGEVDLFLRRRLEKFKKHDAATRYAVESIHHSNGNVSMDDVAYKTCVSPRQLRRKFEEHVGMSPKRFAELTRFARAQAAIHHHQTAPDFADIACQAGYYDQAHFIREFKTFSGLTPSGFLNYITGNFKTSDLYNPAS